MIGTNLSTSFAEVFSHEHTPRDCIADAVRISMSIPLFFKVKRSKRGDIYVDGGLLQNYPVKLFDRKKYINSSNGLETSYYEADNQKIKSMGPASSGEYLYNQETLGFRLDSKTELALFRDQAAPPRRDIENFVDYAKALINALFDAQQNAHLHSDDWQRTIYIDSLGVGTTEFDLEDKRKKQLVESGSNGVKSYFDWWNGQDTLAWNKPGSLPE